MLHRLQREDLLPFSAMFYPMVVDKGCSRHDPIMYKIMRNQSGNLQLWTLINPIQRFTQNCKTPQLIVSVFLELQVEPEPTQIILSVSDERNE